MTPHLPTAITVILALALVTLCYITACAVWPFAACRRCGGTGKHRSPSGRAWRHCHRCHGTGARLRVGRRAWNRYRRSRTR